MHERAAGDAVASLARIGRVATIPTYAVCATYGAIVGPAAALGLLVPAFLLHESLAIVAPLNTLAAWDGLRRHRDPRPVRYVALGTALILVHLLLHLLYGDFDRPQIDDPYTPLQRLPQVVSLLSGGALLLYGTLADLRARRRIATPPAESAEAHDYWAALLSGAHPGLRRGRRLFARLPSNPRCKLCQAPFAGPGALAMRLLGKAPSQKNPLICGECFVKAPIGGAELEVSLLFADVRGSTPLAERVGAAEFRHLINRFYAAATDVLVRSDALVDRLMGDEVIGLYVPGYAGPGHARRAIDAARELLRRTGHADPHGPWLPVGVGVHSGVAFVGAVGSEDGMKEITVLGDAANTTARLASAALAGELLVSDAAAAAAGLHLETFDHRELQLKGKDVPIGVRVVRVAPGS